MGQIRKDQDLGDGTGHFTHLDAKSNSTTITVKTAEGGTQDISGPETVWVTKVSNKGEVVEAPVPEASLNGPRQVMELVKESIPIPSIPVQPEISRHPAEEGTPELVEALGYLMRQVPFTLAWTEKIPAGEMVHISYGREEVWVINPQDLAGIFNGLYQVLKNGPLPLTGAPPSTAARFALALLQ